MTFALATAAVIFFVSHALHGFYRRTRVPEAFWFIGAGYVLAVLGRFPEADWSAYQPNLVTFGLGLFLYLASLTFRFKEAFKGIPEALGLALFGLAAAIAGSTFFGALFQPLPTALFAALCLAAVDTAVVQSCASGSQHGERARRVWEREAQWGTMIALAAALWLAAGYAGGQFDPTKAFAAVVRWVGLSAAVGLGSWFVWAVADRHLSFWTRLRFAPEAWWLLTFAGAERFGFSGAFAGLVLGLGQAQLAVGPRWWNLVFSSEPVDSPRVPALVDTADVLGCLMLVRMGSQLRLTNLNLMIYSTVTLFAVWVTRYLWVQAFLSPKKYTRWEVMSVQASFPKATVALLLASLPLAFPNSAAGWVSAAIVNTAFLSLMGTTLWLLIADRPTARVKAHRLFGRYKEDFGFGEQAAAPERAPERPTERRVPQVQPAIPMTSPHEVPEEIPELAPTTEFPSAPTTELTPAPPGGPFPELEVPLTPADAEPEDDHDKEPTLGTGEIVLEDEGKDRRRTG